MCKQCEHTCATSSLLRRHLKTHSESKAFKFNICEYSANQPQYLKTHMLRHTGEKKFKCKDCKYTSTRSCNLKAHMMKHTGEKPHKCNQCHYRSTTAGALKQHTMKHTRRKALLVQHLQVFLFWCWQLEETSPFAHSPNLRPVAVPMNMAIQKSSKTGYSSSKSFIIYF